MLVLVLLPAVIFVTDGNKRSSGARFIHFSVAVNTIQHAGRAALTSPLCKNLLRFAFCGQRRDRGWD